MRRIVSKRCCVLNVPNSVRLGVACAADGIRRAERCTRGRRAHLQDAQAVRPVHLVEAVDDVCNQRRSGPLVGHDPVPLTVLQPVVVAKVSGRTIIGRRIHFRRPEEAALAHSRAGGANVAEQPGPQQCVTPLPDVRDASDGVELLEVVVVGVASCRAARTRWHSQSVSRQQFQAARERAVCAGTGAAVTHISVSESCLSR